MDPAATFRLTGDIADDPDISVIRTFRLTFGLLVFVANAFTSH
jgi:hypothetical protein